MRLRDDPVPPSQRTSNPIPPALDRIVLDCLVRNPEGRLCSAAELDRLLAAVETAGETIVWQAPSDRSAPDTAPAP
jgi:hypothetical protein